MPARGTFHLLITYLRPQWPRVILLAALLFGGIALQLINPQIIAYVLDAAAGGAPTRALTVAALLFIVFSVGKAVLSFGASYVGAGVSWTATNALRIDLTTRCLHLEMPFHNARTPGTLITRIDGDAGELGAFFADLLINLIGNGALVLGVLVILFLEDWRMGVLGVLFTGVTVAILQTAQRRTTHLYAATREADAALFGFLEEHMAGTEDTRANGGESYVLRQLGLLRRTLSLATIGARMMGVYLFSATHLVFVLATVLGLGAGAALYLTGQMTIGAVYVIVYYIAILQGPLEELRDQVHGLQQATASVNRVNELLHLTPALRETAQASLPAGALSVRCDHVAFAYATARAAEPALAGDAADDREPGAAAMAPEVTDAVLQDIAFALAPGKVLGLLGRTGSGKSTLTRLLVRLYDPAPGTIYLGDHDLRTLAFADLRRRVGMVTQEVQLFQATLRENITFFDASVDDAQILAVLRQLGLWRWYSNQSQGLDTLLGANGAGLSAGEAQLLALVRVFLKDPGLVILDEASSRLDLATEQLLERAIDGLLAGRTGVVIAHRLSTVQRADSILILEGGRIVEFGERAVLAADPRSRFAALLQTGLQEALA